MSRHEAMMRRIISRLYAIEDVWSYKDHPVCEALGKDYDKLLEFFGDKVIEESKRFCKTINQKRARKRWENFKEKHYGWKKP